MPGSDDRQPSAADRPPVSRVGDELRQLADEEATSEVDDETSARLEATAIDRARAKGWYQPLDDHPGSREGHPGSREGHPGSREGG
jgi:hypothetical protein